jgi:hypothetical protein
MKSRVFYLAVAALSLVGAGCASARVQRPTNPASLTVIRHNASIPFANFRGQIMDWSRLSDGSLLIESGGKYYHATVMEPCAQLDTTSAIGFDSAPAGTFNQLSVITVGSHTCPVTGLDEVAKPPSSR